ncbi:MAG: zinc ribbon domain-containing protein [bacterium]
MPIYEFYCQKCNTIYNFLSRTIQPAKRPQCPQCKRVTLSKQISVFAHTGRAKEAPAEGTPAMPMDESKMERAMDALAREADGMSEEDPRQAATLMRKFSDMTGMKLGSGMQEALNRLEAGEDPDSIEAELGDRLEKEDPFILPEKEKTSRNKAPPIPAPRRDATLYEM